jgi:hypothetical protein
MLILGIVTLIGYWRATTPDPSGFGEKQGISARKLVRSTLIANYIGTGLQQFALLLMIPFVVGVISVIGGIIGVVNVFACFTYSRQLALRVPDPAMAKGFRIVMWASAIGMVLVLPVMVFGIVMSARSAATATGAAYVYSSSTSAPAAPTVIGPPATQPGFQAMEIPLAGASTTSAPATMSAGMAIGSVAIAGVGCVALVFGLVFGIWTIILFFKLRRALITAAREARGTWAFAPPVI